MSDFFSSNLKYLREKNNLSQTKLAEKIGVNQTTIARWEDDNRVPTIDNAVDVAEALNIPLETLLGTDLSKQSIDNGNTILKTQVLFDKTKDLLSDDDRATLEFIMQKTIDNYEKNKNENKE